MDFLCQSTVDYYYANLILFMFLSIVCAIFVFLIGREEESHSSLYDRKTFIGLFLLGTLFFGFWSYKAFEDIKDYNEISKGKIGEYYNLEKVGKTLVFEVKKDNNLLKSHFSSTIEEETDSEYILVANEQKVSIPKNIVK